MGFDDGRPGGGYRPLPPNNYRPSTTEERAPRVARGSKVDILSTSRIRELEAEVYRLKNIIEENNTSYADSLISFIIKQPRLDYKMYDDERLSNAYNSGKNRGREEVIHSIQTFIKRYGDGGKI